MRADSDFLANRRRCLRQRVHTPAFASFDGVTGGMVLDLSEEGMAMRTAVPVKALQRVHVQMDLTHPLTHLETTGYIAWADALGRAGVRFSDLPEEARKRLNEWLTINADAPSGIAPKFSLHGSSKSAWPASASEANPSSVTLEAEIAFPEEDAMEIDEDEIISETEARRLSQAVSSGTVQYEFNRLSGDLNIALRIIGERARALTRGAGAAIALTDNGSVMCRASIGTHAPSLGTRLDVNSGFSGECFRTGKSLRCDNVELDSRVNMETCRRLGIRSILAAPIRSQRETMGLLAVFGEQSFNFDEGDVAVVESLAHTVLLTLSKSESHKFFN